MIELKETNDQLQEVLKSVSGSINDFKIEIQRIDKVAKSDTITEILDELNAIINDLKLSTIEAAQSASERLESFIYENDNLSLYFREWMTLILAVNVLVETLEEATTKRHKN